MNDEQEDQERSCHVCGEGLLEWDEEPFGPPGLLMCASCYCQRLEGERDEARKEHELLGKEFDIVVATLRIARAEIDTLRAEVSRLRELVAHVRAEAAP